LTIGLAVLAVVLIVAGTLVRVLTLHAHVVSDGDSKSAVSAAASQARNRRVAAAWVAAQVSPDVTVSCDPVMCTALRGQGFPARDLRPIGQSASYPLTSAVIVVTPVVARQFGTSLATNYAPTVLAAFGPASDRIYVRVTAPHGAAAYESALRADQKISKTVGTGLVTSRQITVTPAARAVMVAGEADSRLLIVITALAAEHPIDILAFGGGQPGMTRGAPLRVVDLAEDYPAAQLSRSAYVRSMRDLLSVQPALYRPAHVSTVSLAGGRKALQIQFGAPTPLGLLSPRQ
jgi:hypothetical protein